MEKTENKRRTFNLEKRPIPKLMALAVLLCLVSEALARRSPVEALRFFARERRKSMQMLLVSL